MLSLVWRSAAVCSCADNRGGSCGGDGRGGSGSVSVVGDVVALRGRGGTFLATGIDTAGGSGISISGGASSLESGEAVGRTGMSGLESASKDGCARTFFSEHPVHPNPIAQKANTKSRRSERRENPVRRSFKLLDWLGMSLSAREATQCGKSCPGRPPSQSTSD